MTEFIRENVGIVINRIFVVYVFDGLTLSNKSKWFLYCILNIDN